MTVQFWNIVEKAYNQQIDATDRINHILGRLSDESIKQIKNNNGSFKDALKNAISKHQENLKEHYNLRREYLQKMADDFNDRSENKNVTSVKSLMK